jgi:hypothetical protein
VLAYRVGSLSCSQLSCSSQELFSSIMCTPVLAVCSRAAQVLHNHRGLSSANLGFQASRLYDMCQCASHRPSTPGLLTSQPYRVHVLCFACMKFCRVLAAFLQQYVVCTE